MSQLQVNSNPRRFILKLVLLCCIVKCSTPRRPTKKQLTMSAVKRKKRSFHIAYQYQNAAEKQIPGHNSPLNDYWNGRAKALACRAQRRLLYHERRLQYKGQFSTALETTDEIPLGHTPVLLNEALYQLNLQPGNVLLDMTFGAGGHSIAALKATPGLTVLALDRDPVAHRFSKDISESFPGQVVPVHGKFSDLPKLLNELNITPGSIDGILFDLGCSSMQFDSGCRGFSVSKNGPLDMRMDPTDCSLVTAADVIANATEMDLLRIFKVYGEEKHYKLVARAIVESRFSIKPITTTHQLCQLVEMVCGFSNRKDKLQRKSHVATKIFQALRIFVNNEINELNYGMLLAHHYLKLGGRVAAISFHSLEDRVVKRHLAGNVVDNAINPLPLKYASCAMTFDSEEMDDFISCKWNVITRNGIVPSDGEISKNPRSRSARLRAAVKVL